MADEPTCPAGELVVLADSGRACHCRIAGELIDERENPASYNGFCTGANALGGNYQRCPTWRADVDRGRELRREMESDGSVRRGLPVRVPG